MEQQNNYCIVLSAEQLSFLAESKYGIDRMKILHQLIKAAVVETTDYSIKGFHTTLDIGQAIMSEVDLANQLRYDKKTISRVLDKMNQLGIVTTKQSNRTSVHTLKCISAWYINGQRVINPFYVFIKDRTVSSNASTSVVNQASGGLDAHAEERLKSSPAQNIHSRMQKTMATSDDDTQSSFPIIDNASPVFSEDGELLVPSTGSDATSISAETTPLATTNDSNDDGQRFNSKTGIETDHSIDDNTENNYIAPEVDPKMGFTTHQPTSVPTPLQPLAEEEFQVPNSAE